MIDGQRVLDSHQHLWQLGEGRYPWLTPQSGELHRSFAVTDVEPLVAASAVDDVLLVQADGTFEDTHAMLAVAAAWDRVVGVVAWAPLDDHGALELALEGYVADPRVVGLRHQIHDEPDPDWIVRPEILSGLGRVAAAGLCYDVVAVTPTHLRHVPTIAQHLPDLPLVIDHLAKPGIAAGRREPWAADLASAAAHPFVSAKISGLDTAAEPGSYTAADLRPYVDHALEHFGADRLMFGSDWPVSILAGGYARWWDVVLELLEPLTVDERTAILGGTARAVYGIGASA